MYSLNVYISCNLFMDWETMISSPHKAKGCVLIIGLAGFYTGCPFFEWKSDISVARVVRTGVALQIYGDLKVVDRN
ncbi:hypothetical protein SAMN05444672_11257 [Bacillus sp. OK838]|nr:hypothetical protein SAMN05444672_11257 [Bacillus sp. OK838]